MGICYMVQETQTGTRINLEGWDGERERREVQQSIPMADSC